MLDCKPEWLHITNLQMTNFDSCGSGGSWPVDWSFIYRAFKTLHITTWSRGWAGCFIWVWRDFGVCFEMSRANCSLIISRLIIFNFQDEFFLKGQKTVLRRVETFCPFRTFVRLTDDFTTELWYRVSGSSSSNPLKQTQKDELKKIMKQEPTKRSTPLEAFLMNQSPSRTEAAYF